MKRIVTRVLRILNSVSTVRRLMVAVVIVAIALGSHVVVTRKERFLRRFETEREWNREHQAHVIAWSVGMQYGRLLSTSPLASLDRVRHHLDLEAKYKRAARYPWLSVEVDPPEPD